MEGQQHWIIVLPGIFMAVLIVGLIIAAELGDRRRQASRAPSAPSQLKPGAGKEG